MTDPIPSSAASDQPVAAPTTTLCSIHNLRYDPRISSGCVLCRREIETATATSSSDFRNLLKPVTLALLVSIALGAFLVMRKEKHGPLHHTPAAMVSGTRSTHAACYSECAQGHSLCDKQCSTKPGDAVCGDYCLSGAHSCFTDCAGRHIKADPPWSYYYGTETMPAWSAVLESSLGLHTRLLACSAAPPVTALVFVRVRGHDGTPASVTLSKRGLSDEAHACAVGVFYGTHFTPSSEGDYAFLARFDARFDGIRMLIAAAESEINALERLVTDDTGEDLKSRLFDAKLQLEKQNEARPPSVATELKEARGTLARLKRELTHLRSGHTRRVTESDPSARRYTEAERLRREQESAHRSEDAQRKREREIREETDRYRRLNREYREQEERAKYQRMWEDRWSE